MYVCAKNLDFRMSPLWKHTHTYTLKAFLFYNDIYDDPKGRSSAPPEKLQAETGRPLFPVPPEIQAYSM